MEVIEPFSEPTRKAPHWVMVMAERDIRISMAQTPGRRTALRHKTAGLFSSMTRDQPPTMKNRQMSRTESTYMIQCTSLALPVVAMITV